MSSNGFWHRIKHKFKGVGKRGRFDVPQVGTSGQASLVAFRRFGEDDLPSFDPALRPHNQVSNPSHQVTVNNNKPAVPQSKQDERTTLQKSEPVISSKQPTSNGISIAVPHSDGTVPKPLPSPPTVPSPIPPSRCSFSDEDPDYATLEEIKREQASIKGTLTDTAFSGEKSSSDSGYETADILLRVPNTHSVPSSPVLLNDEESRKHLLESPGMRNSVSDFPTYDNWQLKQRESAWRESAKFRSSLSEFPTYDNFQFKQDKVNQQTDVVDSQTETSPTKSVESVEDLYATPPQKRKSTCGSGEIQEKNNFDDSAREDAPPIPDRRYERSQSLMEVIKQQENTSGETEKGNITTLQQIPEPSFPAETLSNTVKNDTGVKQAENSATDSSNEDAQQDSPYESVTFQETNTNMNNNSTNAVECQHSHEEPIHMSLEEVRRSQSKLQHDCSICQQAKQSTCSSFHVSTEHSPHPPETPRVTRRNVKNNCIDALECLKDVGWYWGPLSSQEAEAKLDDKPDGAFLVRDSADEHYILSLSFRSNGQTHHTRIEHHKGHFSFYTQPESHGHDSIVEFIQKAMEHSRTHQFLYFMRPHAPGLPPFPVSLLFPFSRYQKMRSLQHMCRFIILKCVRRDHIDVLPLPSKTREYLAEAQYYIEDSEE
ncbi:uncharacterized protein LOC106166888 [Lingula anatina]|uniref:Suppressor of cytokine signaling 7 n=1 Tax=Lingula anatina TaxID=7574 RepID=A0A1S3IS16_LINAN|nr:uncharacterized protein LOC106166888 [Lingula anatina]|eukprot:XP_013401005.1 uncharacterized protein LOC106166888 [Lingula anatina]